MPKPKVKERLNQKNKMKIAVAISLFLFLVVLYQNSLPVIQALESANILVPVYPTPITAGPSRINLSASMSGVNLTQELNNSLGYGYHLNASVFNATSVSECVKVLIAPCDNNIPNQQICVNNAYAGAVQAQYGTVHQGHYACPLFVADGIVSCGIASGYCVVTYQEESAPQSDGNASAT